jgi:putative Holliday junction resolvase
MPLVSLTDLPPKGSLLGLDPGSTTIGVAGCDPSRLIATGLETIVRGKKLAPALDRLFQLYDTRQSVGIVLGLPINMDNTEGPRAQSARSLARHILGRKDVPLAFWDERLSTAGAERALIEADASRARRDELIDKLAAAWILQGAIDRLQEIRR